MISTDAAALAAAMKHAASVTESRNTIPILANVRLTASDGRLEVMTSDLDCEFRQTIECEPADAVLAITVDARRLFQLASAVDKNARITLEEEGGRLSVKAGRSQWQLPVLPATDFPAMPAAELPAAIEAGGAELATAIGRVQWSICDEPSRYYLGGMLIHGEAGKVALVSTNGHTMVRVLLGSDVPEDAPDQILSAKFTRLLAPMCAEAKAVRLEWSADKARATVGDITLTAKGIQGQFPDYRRVIPPVEDSPAVFDPTSLRSALRRVQLVEVKKTRAVKIEREDDKLRLSVSSPEGGTACEELPVSGPAAPDTGFDARYLDLMADAIGGDTIALHQAGAGAPARFERAVPDGAIGVVMPMRV